MDKNNAIKFFLNTFMGGDDEDLRSALSSVCIVKKLNKKEILFLEGDEGKYVYFMISGHIKLFRTNDEGKEAVIHFVKTGELFAEILWHLKNKYPVSSIALEDCVILGMDAKKLYEVIKVQPVIAMKLIAVLAGRIKYFVNMVENLTLADARKRFMNYLNMLRKDSNIITLPVPKGDIALLMGTAPETFSRLLKKLSAEGVILVNGREITILKSDD